MSGFQYYYYYFFFQLILWQFSLFRDIASWLVLHLIAWLPSPVLTHDRRQQIHYLSWSELCITSSMIKKIKANLIAASVAICHLKELCISITWTFSFWVECKFVITSICTDSYREITNRFRRQKIEYLPVKKLLKAKQKVKEHQLAIVSIKTNVIRCLKLFTTLLQTSTL